jgi:hypothetical protein
MLTDQELQEMEARANAATEGPWDVWMQFNVLNKNGRGVAAAGGYQTNVNQEKEFKANLSNAAFIAAARTDLPRVIAELREARAVIESIANSIGDTCAISAIVNDYTNDQIANEYLKREGQG